MTAVPDGDLPGTSASDAELVGAFMAGDRHAFACIYDRYADRLHDFCVGMLRDSDGAADCVQDAFCTAATGMSQLREPDKLRPWLYSIARNEAMRRMRNRRRETPSDILPDSISQAPGPDTLAARAELAELIAEAAGGLSDRDRAVLELAFRHGLNGLELAEALGVSTTNANTLVHRLRETVSRSLGALLVARRARDTGACAELSVMLEGWDGHFTVLMRKRVTRHIQSCDTCDEQRRRMVTPSALLGATPVFVAAPDWLRERTVSDVRLTSAAEPIDVDSSSGEESTVPPDEGVAGSGAPRDRRFAFSVSALVIALFAGLMVGYFAVYRPSVAITPVDITRPQQPASSPSGPVGTGGPPPSLSPPPSVPASAPPNQGTSVAVPPSGNGPPDAAVPPVAELPQPPAEEPPVPDPLPPQVPPAVGPPPPVVDPLPPIVDLVPPPVVPDPPAPRTPQLPPALSPQPPGPRQLEPVPQNPVPPPRQPVRVPSEVTLTPPIELVPIVPSLPPQ